MSTERSVAGVETEARSAGRVPSGGARRVVASVLGVVAGAALLAAPAVAQSPRMELGVDAAVQVAFPDEGDRLTTVEVPLGRVRIGSYVGERTLVEVSGGFALASQSGESASAGRGDLAVSYHFGDGDERRIRPFLLLGGAARFAHRDDATAWQGLAIGGVGVKIPVRRVLGVRLEADYARAFETSELEASHVVRALVGLSFYLGI